MRGEGVGEPSFEVGQFLGVRELKRKQERGGNSQKGKRKKLKKVDSGKPEEERRREQASVQDCAERSGQRRDLIHWT